MSASSWCGYSVEAALLGPAGEGVEDGVGVGGVRELVGERHRRWYTMSCTARPSSRARRSNLVTGRCRPRRRAARHQLRVGVRVASIASA